MSDLIKRKDVIDMLEKIRDDVELFDKAVAIIAIGEVKNLPSAEEEIFEWCHDCKEYGQEEIFEWCHDCKEYGQEKHCCHRWTKVIRRTIEEMRSQQPEQKWIPVTERLPEEDIDVLLQFPHNMAVGYQENGFWNIANCDDLYCGLDKADAKPIA